MSQYMKNSMVGKEKGLECIGPLNFDLRNNRVFTKKRELIFSEKEFGVLLLPARQEGNPLTFEQIYSSVWDVDTPETRKAAYEDIGKVARRLTAAAGGFSWIEIKRGDLYVFYTNWGPCFNSDLWKATCHRFGI